jgi:hypothetical protein
MNRIIIIGAIAVLGAMAAGCDAPSPAPKVQQKVADAKAERSNNVAEARREGTEEVNAQRRDVAEAKDERSYEVALAKAEGDYKVAIEACKELSGSVQADCKNRAADTLRSDKARAGLLKPGG